MRVPFYGLLDPAQCVGSLELEHIPNCGDRVHFTRLVTSASERSGDTNYARSNYSHRTITGNVSQRHFEDTGVKLFLVDWTSYPSK